MKHGFLIYITLAFSSQFGLAKVDPEELKLCKGQGESYSDGYRNQKINNRCESHLFKKTNVAQKWLAPDKSILAYGHNNIVYIKYDKNKKFNLKKFQKGDKVEILSGTRPRLEEIHYLKINQPDKEIMALVNPGNALYTFYLGSNGNIDPIRWLEQEEMLGCNGFDIDHINQRVLLSCPQDASIKIYRLKAHERGRSPGAKTDKIGQISGHSTDIISPKDIVVDEKRVYLLDSERVLIYDLNAIGDAKPLKRHYTEGAYEKLQIISEELFGITAAGDYKRILKLLPIND